MGTNSFYENSSSVELYLEHRHSELSPNKTMEAPAFFRTMGDPAGKRVLDLGCGDGSFAEHLIARGVAAYHGIDSSILMIEKARAGENAARASFELSDIEELSLQSAQYDLVTSRMALHYVSDLNRLMSQIRMCLGVAGRVVFSVVHPVITSALTSESGPRSNWLVDDYFTQGTRTRQWFNQEVSWQHRTVEQYVKALTGNGMRLTDLCECEPEASAFAQAPDELVRRRRIPLVLLLAADAN